MRQAPPRLAEDDIRLIVQQLQAATAPREVRPVQRDTPRRERSPVRRGQDFHRGSVSRTSRSPLSDGESVIPLIDAEASLLDSDSAPELSPHPYQTSLPPPSPPPAVAASTASQTPREWARPVGRAPRSTSASRASSPASADPRPPLRAPSLDSLLDSERDQADPDAPSSSLSRLYRGFLGTACNYIAKDQGVLPDASREAADATSLSLEAFFRDRGISSSPEQRVAWPHDSGLDAIQRRWTALLQQRQGADPAPDLFQLKLPKVSTDSRYVPLPPKKTKGDKVHFMTQTAANDSWLPTPPLTTQLDPQYRDPDFFGISRAQLLAHETNLRSMSHLATMTNNAVYALAIYMGHLERMGLWPHDAPPPEDKEPMSWECIVALLRMVGSSTQQLASHSVAGAMNLQLLRRDAMLLDRRINTRLSKADESLMRVAPMDADDLFGSQALDLQARRDQCLSDRQSRMLVNAGADRPPPRPQQPSQQPQQDSKNKNRKRGRGGNKPSATVSAPPQQPQQRPQQPFRPQHQGRPQQPQQPQRRTQPQPANRNQQAPNRRHQQHGPPGPRGPRPQ